ncbi:hypothetical protein DXB52_15830 [Ruminococcus sp. OM04-4AA]|nr:hypothetical protein DXB52_15830 [Ruminococcus sp. OM04-4AA]
MNLKYYGIEVGIGEKEKLDFTKVFEPVAHKTITSLEKDEENNSKQLPIYDIILAGDWKKMKRIIVNNCLFMI